ncbi:MAG: ABC transporter ATP-binding protein [Clostridiales bacterium]|nr:ABC transporter ATP-binding protein [Candidatus Crickella caballi]
MSHTIELKKASKYYAGNDSVSMGFSRIDLSLDMGEFVAITGESGSGKSTLLNVISGLDTYEEGEMFVCGEDTTAYSTEDYERYRKTYIGNIFQDFNLVNSYSVYQNIELVMLLNGRKKKECRERVNELIELVGLTEFAKTKASKLSGGQKQRVAIARALAKDAPIIVADEPTGNLDSASAAIVMETLARVSQDRLVVIVTHNYEQAEPYVTRKLTMHDGKIIEDRRIPRNTKASDPGQDSGNAVSEPGSISRGAEVRLGLRNAFNIPAKFMLLFIIYLFVATAVLGQYASTKNSLHENELLGYSTYFLNTDPGRIVVTKEDLTEFNDSDIARINMTENIRTVFRNDLAIDKGGSLNIAGAFIEGPVYPIGEIAEAALTYGRLPENEREVVISVDPSSDAYLNISDMREKLIGETAFINGMGDDGRLSEKPVSVAGIIVEEDVDADINGSYNGYSKIYVSDEVSRELLTGMMASASKTVINYGGTKVINDYSRTIYYSDKVPKGKAYIFDTQAYYYKNGNAQGKSLKLRISNKYYEASGKYTVDKVVTDKNCRELLGLKKDSYDEFSSAIFINPADFRKLFERENYQVSAFMENETDSEETVAALNEKGFRTLLIKDTLSDATDGFNFVIELISFARLLLEFIVLFFITYAVIRLIMKSRNEYYSTLRILGANKSNTDRILRVELVFMMLIAYAVDIAFAVLAYNRVINIEQVSKLLNFLSIPDFAITGAILVVMSILIANRYSRKIFSRSAMKVFKEEV